MDKTAQRRGVLQRLHEWSNVSGLAAEKFFSPELKRVMESLRATDDQIRANVVADTIGKAKPIDGAVPLKDLIKKAKSNLARREYMSAVSDLSRFHRQMEAVYHSLKELDRSVDKIHDEFLFSGLGEEQKKYLSEMKERFTPKSAYYKYDLVKEAGIADFLVNIGTKRGRALAMWEKRYPKAAAQLKSDTRSLVDESESLLAITLSALKDMGTARAQRAVDDYVGAAASIKKKYEAYDKLFRTVYARSYQKFIDQLGEMQAPAVKVPDSKELGSQEVETKKMEIPTTFGPSIKTDVPEQATPPVPELNVKAPVPASPPVAPAQQLSPTEQTLSKLEELEKAQPSTPVTPPPGGFIPSAPLPIRPPIPPTPLKVKPEPLQPAQSKHQRFYESLEAMSNESPLILSSYIKKYARSIQLSDPKTAIELLNIAKNIKG